MSDENRLDKTSVVDGDTLKIRLDEASKTPPSLVLLMGPMGLMGKQWPLDREEITIGRDVTCDICLDEKSISKKHCKILKVGEVISIIDLGSTNGTEIKGVRLQANVPTLLNNDDHIKAGNVIFKFLREGNIEAFAAGKRFDLSMIDALTQIFNKGALMAAFEDAFKKAQLTETSLSMIVFDLDHFKKVNDTHGHQAGDYVLREATGIVKNSLIRSGDIFGRYGGEEFVVVLLGGSLQRACEVAERIRQTIEKHPFSFGGKPIPLTVSLGVAALDASVTTPEDLFAKADQAAYASKNAGRNRVTAV